MALILFPLFCFCQGLSLYSNPTSIVIRQSVRMQRLRLALTVNLPKSTTSAFFLENRLTPNFNAHHSLFLSSSIQSRSIQRYSTSTSPPRITPRMRITFTCTAPACTDPGYRSTHEFSKQAYEKGIVLVQCPGCKTR